MNKSTLEEAPYVRELYASIFDANPSAMFIITSDYSVREYNDAAIELPEDVLLHVILPDGEANKIGQALGCIDSAFGCGQSTNCKSCGLAKGVQQAVRGEPLRKVLPMRVRNKNEIVSVEYLMSVAPLQHGDESLALLTLDNTADWFPQRVSKYSRVASA